MISIKLVGDRNQYALNMEKLAPLELSGLKDESPLNLELGPLDSSYNKQTTKQKRKKQKTFMSGQAGLGDDSIVLTKEQVGIGFFLNGILFSIFPKSSNPYKKTIPYAVAHSSASRVAICRIRDCNHFPRKFNKWTAHLYNYCSHLNCAVIANYVHSLGLAFSGLSQPLRSSAL